MQIWTKKTLFLLYLSFSFHLLVSNGRYDGKTWTEINTSLWPKCHQFDGYIFFLLVADEGKKCQRLHLFWSIAPRNLRKSFPNLRLPLKEENAIKKETLSSLKEPWNNVFHDSFHQRRLWPQYLRARFGYFSLLIS